MILSCSHGQPRMHLETLQNRRMTGVMSDTGYIWIDKIKEIRSLIYIKYQTPAHV